jgi:hypothetical protein
MTFQYSQPKNGLGWRSKQEIATKGFKRDLHWQVPQTADQAIGRTDSDTYR